MLNGLDLFSGIGGISLALKQYVRTVAHCEIDPYCQGVLLSRMGDAQICLAPIWDDITTLFRADLPNDIDIIFGGFPCQGISVAGHGKGLADERSGLFWEIVRLAKEIKPKFLFLENTKGILANGGEEAIHTLTSIGYSCRWITKSCKEVGMPQNRERWFCLAYSNSQSRPRLPCRKKARQPKPRMYFEPKEWESWSENESSLLRMADDVSFRLDRTRAMGNSVCIEQTKEAFKELMGLGVEKTS